VIKANKERKHPAFQGKHKTKEKKQWPPSKYPKASGKRQKKDWRCGERPPSRKKGASLEEKQVSKELDLESNEHPTSCEEVSPRPLSPEWLVSLRDTTSRSKKEEPIHQKTGEFALQICSGEVLLVKDGQILNGTKSRGKEKSPKKDESWRNKINF
jgi:hypothetical protein